MASDSKETTSSTSSSFIFGIILGAIIGAVVAVVLYRQDHNQVIDQLKTHLEAFFRDLIGSNSSTSSPSRPKTKASIEPKASVTKPSPRRRSRPKTFRRS